MAWVECAVSAAKKTGSEQIPGKVLGGGRQVQICHFAFWQNIVVNPIWTTKLQVFSNSSQDVSTEKGSNSFPVSYFCFANPGVGTYFSQWFCLRNYFILRASFCYFFLFARKRVFLTLFKRDLWCGLMDAFCSPALNSYWQVFARHGWQGESTLLELKQ